GRRRPHVEVSGTDRVGEVCELRVSAAGEGSRSRVAEPLTVGVPVPPGLCADGAAVRLLDAGGREMPIDARTLERWPDGSVRWVLVDFQGEPGVYRARFDGHAAPYPADAIRIDHVPEAVTLVAGQAKFVVAARGLFSVRIATA